MKQNPYKYAKSHLKITRRLNLSVYLKSFIFLVIVGFVLYAVLFSTYAPVHDFFHNLRHGLMMIPCH
ncbi:MAG: CbtB-domain containing protein [Spirochaetia bacterium]|nr:CbtB-domain containing protein [Spirochaetia bacterium]